MEYKYRIPKQTDAALLLAVAKIRSSIPGADKWSIHFCPYHGSTTLAIDAAYLANPCSDPQLSQYDLQQGDAGIVRLNDPAQGQVMSVERQPENHTDFFRLEPHWIGQQSNQPYRVGALTHAARKHLRAARLEADLTGLLDKEWGRYLQSQQVVVDSLQSTTQSLLVDAARHNSALDLARQEKFDALEAKLQEQTKLKEADLDAQHAARLKQLDEREAALEEREKSFNTKDARYVARSEQQKQITEMQGRLKHWSLTEGTTRKRLPVHCAYVTALVLTGTITILFSYQTLEILRSTDIKQFAWWQWALLSLKSILPFAAFTTFIIYYIRWASAWAQQHSEEEFRERARLVDLGRSTWLLEAVRDAQDNNRELPEELLRELSRNLFSPGAANSADNNHPRALIDFVDDGLTSLRVKAPSGAEIEAQRCAGKKNNNR